MNQTDNTFIQHPFSPINGHKITTSKLLNDFEKQANKGCGLHFEIFEANLLNLISQASDQLNKQDRETFTVYCKRKGYDITRTEEADSEKNEILHEINEEIKGNDFFKENYDEDDYVPF
jgi:spore coat polysaccharide biosynthesis protein SpsF (cytidylyltransferase family)